MSMLPLASSPDGQGINELLLREYAFFLAKKAEGTIEAYLRTARQVMSWIAGRPGNSGVFQPQHLTKTAVEMYLAALEREGFSVQHRARVKSALSTFARWLIEEKGLLHKNPTRGIDLPAIQTLAPRQLSDDQWFILRSLVEQAGDRRGTALFALGYWAGCRVRDVSWLEMAHTQISPIEREAGWSLEEVAYYLGHVTKKGTPAIQTTVRYTQVSREQVKEKLKWLRG